MIAAVAVVVAVAAVVALRVLFRDDVNCPISKMFSCILNMIIFFSVFQRTVITIRVNCSPVSFQTPFCSETFSAGRTKFHVDFRLSGLK